MAAEISYTFCFADIAGSTAMLRTLGDAAYTEVLERYRRIIRESLTSTSGLEVKTEGDGFFLAFADASEAIAFAAAAQRALCAEAWPSRATLRARIGLHRGPAKPRPDGDFVALAVHQAARVEAASHGGQVLVTEAAASGAHVPARHSLHSLGRHRLRDHEGGVELFQLTGPGLPSTFPPVRAARDDHGIPLPRAALLGRNDELPALAALLHDVPLVTLVGPSGVGKTRLALEAAAMVAPTFPDGIHIVPLSSVAGPEHVLGAVATALATRPGPGEDLAQGVVAKVARGRHLLILDSSERVLDGVVEVVDLVLRRCPDTCILVTSTQAISLPDERVVRVGPLAVPEIGSDASDAFEAPAVRLLVQRVGALGGSVGADEAEALTTIARRLDGVPLALELAAGRIAELGVAGVVSGLDDRFALLTGGFRTALPRHQALETAVAWSVDLLKPDDRSLLSRLARLQGRVQLEHAVEVCGGDLAAIQRLTSQSLIAIDQEPTPRIRMLDTIRAFAIRELEPPDQREVDLRRQDWLLQRLPVLKNMPEREMLQEIDELIDDIRQAVDAAVAPDLALAARLAAGVTAWFEYRGLWTEGLAILDKLTATGLEPAERALTISSTCALLLLLGRQPEAGERARAVLDEPAAPPRARAMALMHLHPIGYVDEGPDPLEEALELTRDELGPIGLSIRSRWALRLVGRGEVERAIIELGAVADEAKERGYTSHEVQALVNRGGLLVRTGHLDEGEAALIDGRARADEIGLPAMSWAALSSLATIALHRGDPARALALAEERVAIAEQVGDERGAGAALTTMQAAALALGDTARAFAAGEKVVALFRRTGDVDGLVVGTFNLVQLGQSSGDVPLAARAAAEAVEAATTTSLLVAQRLALLGCAGLACAVGDARGFVLLGAGRGIRGGDVNLDPSDIAWLDSCEEHAVAALGADAAARGLADGAALDVTAALALAATVANDLA